jgi:hypothetical protein
MNVSRWPGSSIRGDIIAVGLRSNDVAILDVITGTSTSVLSADFIGRVKASEADAGLSRVGNLRCGRVPRELANKVPEAVVLFGAWSHLGDGNLGYDWEDSVCLSYDGLEDRGASKIVTGVMGRQRNNVGKRQWRLTGLLAAAVVRALGRDGAPPNLKLLLSWPSEGLEFLDEARGLPGRSRTMSTEGLSMGRLRRRQYSSSSEGIVSCDPPISSIGKSFTVAERPAVEVEESWISMDKVAGAGPSGEPVRCAKSCLVAVRTWRWAPGGIGFRLMGC